MFSRTKIEVGDVVANKEAPDLKPREVAAVKDEHLRLQLPHGPSNLLPLKNFRVVKKGNK